MSNLRRPWPIGIYVIPRVLLGIIQSQILHLFFIIIILFFLLFTFIIPRVGAIRRAFRIAVKGICLLGVKKP